MTIFNTGVYIFHSGDRVFYVSNAHGVADNNPMVGTSYECAGTVGEIHGPQSECSIEVCWDNGTTNSYTKDDLVLEQNRFRTGKPNPNIMFKRKKQRR